MNLLRDSGVRLPAESACAKALADSAGDTATPGALARARARHAGRHDGQRAREAGARIDGGQGPDGEARRRRPRSPKPGAGRPALYRLQPLLQDSSPDVRAAAAGGLVRACGDLALPFVQPMFKERDDRALVAMAPELGPPQVAESADMLAKMMAPPRAASSASRSRAAGGSQGRSGKALRAKAFDSIRRAARRVRELRGLAYAERVARRAVQAAARSGAGAARLQGVAAREAPQPEALDWLIAQLRSLSPDTAVDLLRRGCDPPAAAHGATEARRVALDRRDLRR